jgi:hypothetical protein
LVRSARNAAGLVLRYERNTRKRVRSVPKGAPKRDFTNGIRRRGKKLLGALYLEI